MCGVCALQAVSDMFIWAPNAVGVCLGVVQLVLRAVLPSMPSSKPARPEPAHGAGQQDDASLTTPLTGSLEGT